MILRSCLVFALFVLAIHSPVQAEPIVYPAGGQSPEQQQNDTGECHSWATQNTGIDPAALASQSAQQQQELAAQAQTPTPDPQKSRGGAVRGAAAGAVVGEIVDDDAGKGAAYGAAAGAIAQRRRNVKGQQAAAEQQAATQQQLAGQQQALAADQQQQMETYYRAYGACMTGRGYTVN